MARKSKYLEALAVGVACGKSIKQAAEQAGCSESQAYKVSGSDDFKTRVAEIRTESTNKIVGLLAESASDAVQVLAKLMQDSDQKGAVRVAAAKAILANVGPAMDLHELRARIDTLELGALE